MIIEATKTDLLVSDVPENEVFPIEEFAEFRVRLINIGVRPNGRRTHYCHEIPLSTVA